MGGPERGVASNGSTLGLVVRPEANTSGYVCVIVVNEVSGGKQRDRVLSQLREGWVRGSNCGGIGSQSVLELGTRLQVLTLSQARDGRYGDVFLCQRSAEAAMEIVSTLPETIVVSAPVCGTWTSSRTLYPKTPHCSSQGSQKPPLPLYKTKSGPNGASALPGSVDNVETVSGCYLLTPLLQSRTLSYRLTYFCQHPFISP